MVVCRYFLENKCRFGENCRFEHPRADVQRNLFGQKDDSWGKSRVTFGNTDSHDNSRDKFKWAGNSNQQPQSALSQTQPLDLVNTLPREVEVWEKSKMWPFSCISMEKDIPSLPGLYDISVEELRFEAYTARKAGNMQPYIERFQNLMLEFQGKRQQLKQMTGEVKQKLVVFLEEMRKKKPGASQGSMGSFSQTAQGQSSQGMFGKPSGLSAATSNPFAQGGQQQPAASGGVGLFGKPAANSSSPFASAPSGSAGGGSLFGGNSSFSGGSTFGNAGAGLFGKQPAASTSANPFASPTQAGQPGLFGGNASSSMQQPGGSGMMGGAPSGGFGSSGNSSAGQQSLFGKPVTGQMGGGAFGSQQPSAFGQGQAQQGQGFLGSAGNKPFGGAFSQAQKPGLLGAAPTGFSPLAGGGQQTQQTLFGKPVSSVTPGGSTMPQPGLFSSSQGSLSAGQSPLNASVSTAPPAGSEVNPGRYTAMDQLTDAEKAEFQAAAFTPGRVPLRPPPRELINVGV